MSLSRDHTAPSDADPHGAQVAKPDARARLRWLLGNLRLWALALALLLLGVVVAGYSFGAFTTESANPLNTASSGSMDQVSTKPDEAIMTATDLVPGHSVNGSVSITNQGDASGDFTLTARDLVDVPGPNGGKLSTALRLRVSRSGTADPIYTGTLAGLGTVSLGRWAPDEKRTFQFQVSFPDNAYVSATGGDNRFQKSSCNVTFVWDATQAH